MQTRSPCLDDKVQTNKYTLQVPKQDGRPGVVNNAISLHFHPNTNKEASALWASCGSTQELTIGAHQDGVFTWMRNCVVTHRGLWPGKCTMHYAPRPICLGRFALTGKQTVPHSVYSTYTTRLTVEWMWMLLLSWCFTQIREMLDAALYLDAKKSRRRRRSPINYSWGNSVQLDDGSGARPGSYVDSFSSTGKVCDRTHLSNTCAICSQTYTHTTHRQPKISVVYITTRRLCTSQSWVIHLNLRKFSQNTVPQSWLISALQLFAKLWALICRP